MVTLSLTAFHSQLYTGDCYIVLKTEWNENSELDWTIHFWIGNDSSVGYFMYTCIVGMYSSSLPPSLSLSLSLPPGGQ